MRTAESKPLDVKTKPRGVDKGDVETDEELDSEGRPLNRAARRARSKQLSRRVYGRKLKGKLLRDVRKTYSRRLKKEDEGDGGSDRL